MQHLEVLVLKLLPIDALAAGSIVLCEITALDHELLDNTVEGAALVVEGHARFGLAFLAGAEGAEVLGRLGYN